VGCGEIGGCGNEPKHMLQPDKPRDILSTHWRKELKRWNDKGNFMKEELEKYGDEHYHVS
jgi:hypothetical protein